MASLKKAINIMYRLTFAIAGMFFIATAVGAKQIMHIYSAEELVILAGSGYLLVSLPCFFLHGTTLTTSLVLRSVGKANIPLIASVCSFFINIFFNWIFIFGNLGAPRLETRGAALGTLIARVVEFTVTMGYFFFKEDRIRMRPGDLRMKCGDLAGEYIRISIPVLISDTLLGIGISAVSVVMGHIGSAFVAANSITMVTQQLSTIVLQGISQSSCAVTGITLGNGDVKKAQEQGVTFAAIGLIVGLTGCALIFLLRGPIIHAYKITPETQKLAYELMDAVAITVIFLSMNNILTKGVLRGGGDTRFLMVADILFLWCVSIPLGALAGLVWHWPAFWIYIMLKIDQFIKAIWCLFRLKSGKWIKKIEGAGIK